MGKQESIHTAKRGYDEAADALRAGDPAKATALAALATLYLSIEQVDYYGEG